MPPQILKNEIHVKFCLGKWFLSSTNLFVGGEVIFSRRLTKLQFRNNYKNTPVLIVQYGSLKRLASQKSLFYIKTDFLVKTAQNVGKCFFLKYY